MADQFTDSSWMANALKQFYEHDPLIIFCLPPLEVVKKNVASNHDHSTKHLRGVHTGIEAIWNLYAFRVAQEGARSGHRTWVWDYTYEGADAYYQAVLQICEAVSF